MDIRSLLGPLRLGLVVCLLAQASPGQCLDQHFASADTPLTLFAYRLDTDGVRLAVRARTLDRVYVFESLGGTWVQTGQVTPPDLGTLSYGQPVAIDGDTLVVGQWTSQGGTAHVYGNAGGSWSQTAQFIDDAADPGGMFAFDVDVSGDVIVVGAATGSTGPGVFPGLAHVYERVGGRWDEVARLVPPDPALTLLFGQAVAVDGERIAVACDRPGPDAIFVYERVAGVWGPTAEIPAPSAQNTFGVDLALDGDTLAVADPFFTGPGGNGLGAVHVYGLDGGSWVHEATLTRSDAIVFDDVQFAERIDLDGDRLVVSAAGDDNLHGLDAGAVYTYLRQGGSWIESAKFLPPNPSFGASFGEDVTAAGGLAFAGAPHGFDPTPDGAVHQLDLAATPSWASVGGGLPGGGPSAPRLEVTGTGCPGHLIRFEMSGAHADPGGLLALVVGTSPAHTALLGGTLVPSPDLILFSPVPPAFAGSKIWSGTLPEVLPAGLSLWVQAWAQDFAGPQGWAATQAVRVDTD